MRKIHPLPSLLTLANFGCGFVAIVLAARSLVPEKMSQQLPFTGQQTDVIYLACAFIFVAMLFDMLDGKVARMTGSACRFGGELDSLADVVTFGIAPAVILTASWIRVEPDTARWWSIVLGFGFVYAACACVRLARYNVEMGVTAKDYFRGLPSPAAAGAVVSMFLLINKAEVNAHLLRVVGKPLLTQLVAAYMLLMGLLMVSRVRYPHLSNKLLGERKRVGHLVAAIFLFFLLVQIPIYLLAVGFNAYAVYGLACAVVHRLRRGLRRRSPAADAPGGDSADEEPPADAAQTAPSERSAP